MYYNYIKIVFVVFVFISIFSSKALYAGKFEYTDSLGFKLNDSRKTVEKILDEKGWEYSEELTSNGGKYILIKPIDFYFCDLLIEEIRIVYDKKNKVDIIAYMRIIPCDTFYTNYKSVANSRYYSEDYDCYYYDFDNCNVSIDCSEGSFRITKKTKRK